MTAQIATAHTAIATGTAATAATLAASVGIEETARPGHVVGVLSAANAEIPSAEIAVGTPIAVAGTVETTPTAADDRLVIPRLKARKLLQSGTRQQTFVAATVILSEETVVSVKGRISG
jgi:hypothetical protein